MTLQSANELGIFRTLPLTLAKRNATFLIEWCTASGETLLQTAVLHHQLEADNYCYIIAPHRKRSFQKKRICER
ncbi:uncharacterized protein PHALS_15174 [Plasmopara halstedii]|uniref:Uncharacterized protein n=1 Tax=Plasmopara halstedii TaxID=4781 RepID=A0A0P1B392_PLAHL|nr:uncharacterized protein PHALS_15174 [Plasmopara halstedii]CEG48777.1 hypothetical protein PHALS_15174 [Plasmopara halstedii]|eukprot:XP_024585146.1 hypothetical protein PHALS_15174 [Plasmopara halstedii]